MAVAHPGSFRDPLSRVFVTADEVFRGLTAEGLHEFESVEKASFFVDLQRERKVVTTERLDPTAPVPDGAPTEDRWAAVLRHERVPVVSYPYEWTFEMLRDAALLQLEVSRRALVAGFNTKDATSYNVQFDGTRPVFIDVGSFEKARKGEPWPGYRQFCELFLNPLVVQAVLGTPFHPWLRGSLDGISPAALAPLVRGRGKLQKGMLVHVVLHGRAEHRFADTDKAHDVQGELKKAGFSTKLVLAQIENLERTVRALKWGDEESTWSDYSDRSHYSDADLGAKEEHVGRVVAQAQPGLVLDLGANDARFSALALEHGADRVVAVDSDHLVVDRLYRHLRETGESRILPLVLDLADPSPSLGWRSRERASFVERVRPDLLLCLAVVHHLALTDTVPLDEIVAFLADFDCPVVVEFPHRDDPMVKRLLARKRPGVFDHYDVAEWEKALGARFRVEEQEVLPSGRRTLYRCTPLTTS